MFAVRFGSYSMVSTFPGTSCLSRRKSITRYRRLCPPPRCRIASKPRLSRPPVRFFVSSNGLCGVFAEPSVRAICDLNRVPGLVGLNILTAMSVVSLGPKRLARLEEFDLLLSGRQTHPCLLPVRSLALIAAGLLGLSQNDRGPDIRDLHAEKLR